jgi:hypothetical protein
MKRHYGDSRRIEVIQLKPELLLPYASNENKKLDVMGNILAAQGFDLEWLWFKGFLLHFETPGTEERYITDYNLEDTWGWWSDTAILREARDALDRMAYKYFHELHGAKLIVTSPGQRQFLGDVLEQRVLGRLFLEDIEPPGFEYPQDLNMD